MPRVSQLLPRLLLIALFLAAPLIHGQESAAGSSGGYAVRGAVVNATTGQPVARALVNLNEEYAVLTGGDGQFSFDNLPAGMYMVSVRKPGYVGFGSGARSYSIHGAIPRRMAPPHRIVVGPDMPSLTFRVTPAVTIVGTVTLSTADPADGIHVTVYRQEVEEGRTRWVMGGNTDTRSDGSFRLGDLPPGRYMIYTRPSLDRPQGTEEVSGPVWGYPALYYPGVTDPSSAGVLALAPGQQGEADFTLTRQQFFAVTALVRSSEEDSASNFQILDSGGRPTYIPARFDRRTGLVHANVPSGAWTLEARVYGRGQSWGRTDFQVTGAPVTFAISIVPIPHIPVIIHREFTASNGGQPVESGAGISLALSAEDAIAGGMGAGGGLRRAGDGSSWELMVFAAGRFWVMANPYPPAYISSITMGGTNLASNPVVVSPGSSLAPIEVTLRDDVGNIAGQINQPAGGNTVGEEKQVWVYAIPLFPSSASVQDLMPNDNGQFSFYHVAPGSYRVVACDTQQDIDAHSPEGMAAWAGKGSTVTVDANGTANVQLDVIHVESSE